VTIKAIESGPVSITEHYAELRLGRGHYLRKLTRLGCRLRGHNWIPWTWEREVEPVEDEGFAPIDPSASDRLLWYRGCHRDCGTIQMARATLLQRAALPGEIQEPRL
jgi:hypothetical protein